MAQMSWLLMRIRPEVGCSRRMMWRNSVLLPVPLPPRITMVSPVGKSRLTWFRMQPLTIVSDQVLHANHRAFKIIRHA